MDVDHLRSCYNSGRHESHGEQYQRAISLKAKRNENSYNSVTVGMNGWNAAFAANCLNGMTASLSKGRLVVETSHDHVAVYWSARRRAAKFYNCHAIVRPTGDGSDA